MTDPDYSLEIAIRADEKAKAAHDRLDRMNGSIDRLAGNVAETNGKIDSLLSRNAGIEQATRRFIDSRRFVIASLLTCLVVIATLSYFAFGK